MAWFLNSYHHDECEVSWTDEWSCCCDDRCPVCNAEMTPLESEDLSVVIERHENGKDWVVLVSAPSAEDKPDYEETVFRTKREAEGFAKSEMKRVEEAWSRVWKCETTPA